MIYYLVAYILGGKNPSSDLLDGQFWEGFASKAKIYDQSKVGDYTKSVLGWNQPKLTAEFIKKRGSSVFCKLISSLGIIKKFLLIRYYFNFRFK